MNRRRVLIITSSFCPAMLPDMHRARMLCFDLPKVGWDVEVLTADASYKRAVSLDADAEQFFASDVPVHEVGPWLPRLFRALRIGSICWRAWVPMYRAGNELLGPGRFDLVYFSTTQFALMCLGPLWRARHGIPYVLDFQDPWYRPSQKYFTTEHVFKARATNWLSKHLERRAVVGAGGLVSVSPRYLEELNARYADRPGAWSEPSRQAVIPFAASRRDLDCVVQAVGDTERVYNARYLTLVYVGAGGITRAAGFEALCQAITLLRASRDPLVERVRIRLYGTSAGTSMSRGKLTEIARRHGLHELVEEESDQVSYFDSLRFAAAADGLLILGVDDRSYTPSKLFNYLLFGKPVLACFQKGSPAEDFVLRHPETAAMIRFGGEQATSLDRSVEIVKDYLQQVAEKRRVARTAVLEDNLAPAMAQRHGELFARVIGQHNVALPSAEHEAPVR